MKAEGRIAGIVTRAIANFPRNALRFFRATGCGLAAVKLNAANPP